MGEWLYYNSTVGSVHTQKLCSRLYSTEIEFYSKKQKKSLFEPPFRGHRGKVRTPYIARWKARGRLSIRHNWTFSLSLTVETLWAEICRSRRFLKGWVTLSENFRRKGASPVNHCWCQKTRVIAVWCGIKISAVHYLVFSQSTHVTDRRTELQLRRPR